MKVLLNIAHTEDTPYKASPDGRFSEWEWSTRVVYAVASSLAAAGYHVAIIPQKTYYGPSKGLKQVVDAANKACAAGPCIFVSIHANKSADSGWQKGRGWSVYTSKGKTESDKIAEYLYEAAKKHLPDKKMLRDLSDGDSDIEADFYVLKNTKCPAVLTENLFYDNKEDLAFLESKEGFAAIVKLHVEGITKYLRSLNG